jgi:DNA repair exonuclease SbcCD ATPase subunit
MSGWLLQSIEIEGFRGINNEGDPLTLRFKPDCVSSISAPNGVGKSSIFDAVSFAIRGSIPKLDNLAASEDGPSYYVNRFHSSGVGSVTLTLVPDGGGTPVPITVRRDVTSGRTVSGPSGVDAEAVLQQLDREFVLLDHETFRSFIDEKDLERGRSFAGLLGLKRYSELRQTLQGLANTRAFNNHFGTANLEYRRGAAEAEVRKQSRAAQLAFEALTKKALADHRTANEAESAAHQALHQIPLLKPHCEAKPFDGIDLDGCLTTVKEAEGGEDRARLAELLQQQAALETIIADSLTEANYDRLRDLAATRDDALSEVGSALLRQHYQIAERVLSEDTWLDKNLCPTCDVLNDNSVLDKVRSDLERYQAVQDLSAQIATAWAGANWASLTDLENAAREEGEPAQVAVTVSRMQDHSLTAAQVDALWARRTQLQQRLSSRLETVRTERLQIEQRLPPSLVEVTTTVEAARRLRESWSALRAADRELTATKSEQARVARIKRFLDTAAGTFASAESNASRRRLAAVQPLCRTLFAAIIHDPVEPALIKPAGAEELAISLARFWTLQNVSAQALLAESCRNAFAVSVYLAAAQLYGGDARFMLLDDVTSSFDAGHQFHLMEVIRTTFARPGQPAGPQVILLSHDTLLEKLFNKNASGPNWQHVRLEGTARTAVLPQSSAANRVRDATVHFLNAGQVEDGALRLRQYLEYKLLEIIGRVNIPVPVDFALDDTKKQVQAALDAIQSAVALHLAANQLVLTAQQQAGLRTHVASITGNFLAHYATGSTQAFSASSLLGVVRAIDDYAECFMYEEPRGSGRLRYYQSLSRL